MEIGQNSEAKTCLQQFLIFICFWVKGFAWGQWGRPRAQFETQKQSTSTSKTSVFGAESVKRKPTNAMPKETKTLIVSISKLPLMMHTLFWFTFWLHFALLPVGDEIKQSANWKLETGRLIPNILFGLLYKQRLAGAMPRPQISIMSISAAVAKMLAVVGTRATLFKKNSKPNSRFVLKWG